jgi:UDP-glucose 4-epimerase
LRILITGGAGFIGSNLAERALSAGHEVSVIDDFSTGFRENLADLEVRLVSGSILDADALNESLKDVESVVHLAALGSVPRSIHDPMATHAANATGTLCVLEAARGAGVSHLVAASSSSVYGLNPALPKHEREWVRPLSPYAVTKLATEQYVLAYQQAFGMETTSFRLFNVFGPRQRAGHVYAAVIPTFIDALMRDEPLWINGDGSNSRDFTYVGTVCNVLLKTCERRLSDVEPINLAFGTSTTLIDLVAQIETVAGRPAKVEHREARAGDVPHSQAANAKLVSRFPGIEPVSLDVGLAETVAWFKKEMP